MSYVIQAVLSNAQHPEYGQVTIPFPIPNQNYDCTIELLEPLEIGDTLRQDCQVDELDSFYTVLNALIGTQVTLDELDYLAKRLDSFDDGEAAQFQGMAHKLGLSKIKDLINLTFCCQKATVITDFSDLEKIGREHYMNLNGGCARTEDLEALDGTETAYLLIDSGAGTVTPYPPYGEAQARELIDCLREVAPYADKQELEESIIRRHYGTIVMDSEQPQGGGTSAGGMAQGIQAAPDFRKTVFRP